MEGMTLDICVHAPAAPAVVSDAKTYTLTPESVSVQAGIVAGELTGMRVVGRTEKSTGRVISPARLTGTLKLINTSANQSVRLVAGKIQYLNDRWRPIEIEESRTDATFTLSTYGSERLDPGQQAGRGVDVVFRAEALKARKVKGLRLKIAYILSPYREEAISFGVSIGGQAD